MNRVSFLLNKLTIQNNDQTTIEHSLVILSFAHAQSAAHLFAALKRGERIEIGEDYTVAPYIKEIPSVIQSELPMVLFSSETGKRYLAITY